MASYTSSQPKSVSDATSIIEIDTDMIDLSSSPPVPSSQASSTHATPAPQTVPTSQPDYSAWTAERYAMFPGLVASPDSTREKAWWWQHGYRMKDERNAPDAKAIIRWICVRCFSRRRSNTKKYNFVASTGTAIIKHLKEHSIRVSCASLTTRRRPTNDLPGTYL
jgi:hypothetical protein